jgi:hypothetical protein
MGIKIPLVLPEIEYGTDCPYCEPGKTPKYVTVTISGVIPTGECNWSWSPLFYCPWGSAYSENGLFTGINTTFVLKQRDDFPCDWVLYDAFVEERTCFEYPTEIWKCTGRSCVRSLSAYIEVYKFNATHAMVDSDFGEFQGTYLVTPGSCVEGSVANEQPPTNLFSGGFAKICEGDWPICV